MGISTKSVENYSIREWWFLFTGKFQSEAKLSGLEPARLMLHHELAGPETAIEQHEWYVNLDDLMARVKRWQPDNGLQRFNVLGYSLGGGTAVEFTRRLSQMGQYTDSLWLLDGKDYPAPWLNWTALWRTGTLVIDRRVKTLRYWRQHNNLPSGSDIVFTEPFTKLILAKPNCDCRHQGIDEEPTFYEELRRVIQTEKRKRETGA